MTGREESPSRPAKTKQIVGTQISASADSNATTDAEICVPTRHRVLDGEESAEDENNEMMNRIEFTSNGDLIVRFHDENGRETESRVWSEGEQMVTVRQFFADGHAVGVQNAMELLAADHFGMSILDEHCDSWNDAINRVLARAAFRRIISTELGAYGDEHDSSYVLDTQTIEDYTRDELVEAILAVMLENVWREREEVLIVAARGLGFARVGRKIRAAFASAFNGAIRRGLLKYDGTLVRQP